MVRPHVQASSQGWWQSEGEPARETSRLVLARTGRTDHGCRCPPRLLGRRTPLAAHQSRLPTCCTLVRSFRLSCPLLLDAVRVTTRRDQSGEEKMKGNAASQERGANGQCISKSLAQVIAVCYCISDPFFFSFFFLTYPWWFFSFSSLSNPLWKKKQEREWQGDNTQMAFHPSIDYNRINDTERQGSFIYFASWDFSFVKWIIINNNE